MALVGPPPLHPYLEEGGSATFWVLYRKKKDHQLMEVVSFLLPLVSQVLLRLNFLDT